MRRSKSRGSFRRRSRCSLLTACSIVWGKRSRRWKLSAVSSQFSVLSSQFSVLSSRFSVLSSQFSALSSQFSVLSSQFSVLSSQFSVLSSQFSVLSSLLHHFLKHSRPKSSRQFSDHLTGA